MSVKPEVQAYNMNFNPILTFYIINQIYLTIFHPTPSAIIIKWYFSFAMEVLEQPGSETLWHNVVAICECCPSNVDNQKRYWL